MAQKGLSSAKAVKLTGETQLCSWTCTNPFGKGYVLESKSLPESRPALSSLTKTKDLGNFSRMRGCGGSCDGLK